MKVPKLAFPAVAVVVAAMIGLIYHDIIPTFKEVTASHHSQSAAYNTKDDAHQEEPSIDHAAGLKPEASTMFLPGAPVAALNDQQHRYHANSIQRDLGSSSCEDSPLKVLTTKKIKSAKTCAFISKKPNQRCKKDAIKSHCPNACRSCKSFGTSDSEATFLFEGNKTTCAWLNGRTIAEAYSLCQVDSIRATCRESCSFFCADGPNQPSTSPTTSPAPSPLPSSSPITSMSPSTSPTTSSSPTKQCQGKITSIIDEYFGDVTKGPPQEEAYTWLVEDITDDECDDKAKILQRYILAVLYFSTGGGDWNRYYEGWLGNGSECDWEEVDCNDNQQVTQLSLWYNNLRGTIPAELGSLTNLEFLVLDDNNLSGSIPGSIFQLSQLKELWLDYNDLTGTIPDNFGGSTSLEWISLFHNLLTGTIPEITGDSLQGIERLSLGLNKMSGPVPDSLCALRSSKPSQFYALVADCAPPNNAQNPCPSGCCTKCTVGKGLP